MPPGGARAGAVAGGRAWAGVRSSGRVEIDGRVPAGVNLPRVRYGVSHNSYYVNLAYITRIRYLPRECADPRVMRVTFRGRGRVIEVGTCAGRHAPAHIRNF